MVLSLLQWNIQGYINNYNYLEILIKRHRPHIISLQETHIKHNTNIPVPINFQLYTSNAPINSFAGSALLVHNSIHHEPINVITPFDIVALKIHSKQIFTISSVYISPSKNFCLQDLSNTFNYCNEKSLITGDFNSWHTSCGSKLSNKRGKIISDFIAQSNYILLNDGSATHHSTHKTFTNIDISFSTTELTIDCSWKVDSYLSGSDHYPILISLFNSDTISYRNYRPQFNLKKADWDNYDKLSTNFCLERPISYNINKEAANLQKIILQSANQSIPQHISNKSIRSVPWWNKKLEELKKEKNRMWNQYNRNITTENLLKYKKSNAIFKKELKSCKRESLYDFTSQISPTTKTEKIWCTIRRFCGLKPRLGIHCINHTPDQQTSALTDPKDISNLFAKQWSKESNDTNFPNSFQQQKYSELNHTITFTPSKNALQIEGEISNLEFSIALNKLKGKTPGLDKISYPLIKNLSITAKERTIKLFNAIFNSHIPQIYKNSLVIPILKPNSDKTLIKSYRPISLNSCISKLLDRIIADRLWWFLTNSNLINANQLGFRKGKSLYESLVSLDHLIKKALSIKKHLSLISLDFTKAFDKIGIHSILEQLRQWKIGPKIYNYIKNFMSNRNIKVRVNSAYSDTFPIWNGIPQGSPLSVVLFLIAYNKLANIINMHKQVDFLAYADDFIIIQNLKKQKNSDIDLKKLFDDILLWCSNSGAQLSIEKCKHLHICRKQNCTPLLTGNNTTIESVDKLKILGVTLNKNYRWNSHIDSILASLHSRLNIIKCLSSKRFNCNTITLLSLLKTILKSKIEYSLFLYGNAPKTTFKKINSILNSSIRIALGAYRTSPINNMLFESNIINSKISTDFQIAKLSKYILFNDKSPIFRLITKIKKSKRESRVPSILINY